MRRRRGRGNGPRGHGGERQWQWRSRVSQEGRPAARRPVKEGRRGGASAPEEELGAAAVGEVEKAGEARQDFGDLAGNVRPRNAVEGVF